MNKTQERLMAYRRAKQKEENGSAENSQESSHEQNVENNRVSSGGQAPGIWQRLNIDVLDAPPFCTWRKCYESRPRLTIAVTGLAYIAGQIFFAWAQFGLVFFAVSLLMAIWLSLGTRSEGEISAYSVFNPNCERLLGQMTAEHFERDVLRRRVN
ncbi:hypothetical protein Q1695_003032 [Nippostrongylus brasiliensis]|nr:hypothetical protein Q1695_003032 [Nippostrongylus brasiliensis]